MYIVYMYICIYVYMYICMYIYIYIQYTYIYILHFSAGASSSRVSGAPALALPEKCEKVKPVMQTNVRLPPDTLAGAS